MKTSHPIAGTAARTKTARWALGALALLAAAAFAVTIARLDKQRRNRQAEATALRSRRDELVGSKSRANRAPATAPPSATEGDRIDDPTTELHRLQQQVTLLEQAAARRRAEIQAASAARLEQAKRPPHGTDPEQALTKLENFQNVGRDTPAHALQTLVWAAMKGDEATLTSGILLDEKATHRAEMLLARLPDGIRGQYNAEKLAALWFEGTVLDSAAAQIIREEPQDAAHAAVIVSGGIGDAGMLSFEHTANGWRLIVPQHGLEVVQKKVLGASPPLPR